LLALFYAVIDVAGFHRWAFFFAVIGANALLAYVLDPFFDWSGNAIVSALIPRCPARIANFLSLRMDLFSSFCELALLWLLLWYLYRKRLFLRA
jgi:hypothetical protein